VVSIGKNCVIDPSATIHGLLRSATIVRWGRAVVENCIIGDNVNVSQGCS
jgi:UDP-3-O-[3-hydroxymyristoyl] glucosamine N-acyltransferase